MESPFHDDQFYDSESDYPIISDEEDNESCEDDEYYGDEEIPKSTSETKPELSKDNGVEIKDSTNEISDKIRGWRFDTIDQAEDLYKTYALNVGFNVRRESSKVRPCGIMRYREWVCSCEGFNEGMALQREAKTETRCGCKARFRVAHDLKDQVYKVTHFVTDHNHDLEDARKLKRNRSLGPFDKFVLAEMTDAGIKPCLVMDYMEDMLGEVGALHFKKKDGYNYLHKRQRDMIRGGDVNTAISMFEGIKEVDEGFFFDHCTAVDGTLARLFFRDSKSKAEFETFSDVLCMDSTYLTNGYNMPVVLFIGVDNHYNTCLFGVGVLYDETIPSYRWLLRAFKTAMNGKAPSVVLTDQDASMAEAIAQEWEGTRHRLCSWHLMRNARQNVKNPDFVRDFGYLLRKRCSPEEFETRWAQMIEEYGLVDNSWALGVYEKREYWADAYFKGVFLAGMRSTQRSESMNSRMKLHLKRGLKLTQLFKQYNRKVRRMRTVFLEKQSDAEKNRLPFKKLGLEKLEQHAADVCTKTIFQRVREQIRKEQHLVTAKKVQVSDYHYEFSFHPYDMPNGKHFDVTVKLDEYKFLCECGKLEFRGVPCSHIIAALKRIGFNKFPRNSIHPRWTIDAGKDLKARFPSPLPESDTQLVLFGRVQKAWGNLAHISSKVVPNFDINIDKVKNLAAEIEQDVLNTEKYEDEYMDIFGYDGLQNGKAKAGVNVLDPQKIKAKGAPKGKQQCGLCHEIGHNKRRCPLNPINASDSQPIKRARTSQTGA